MNTVIVLSIGYENFRNDVKALIRATKTWEKIMVCCQNHWVYIGILVTKTSRQIFESLPLLDTGLTLTTPSNTKCHNLVQVNMSFKKTKLILLKFI